MYYMATSTRRRERGTPPGVPPSAAIAVENAELVQKLEAFERKFDEQFRTVFDAIRKRRRRRRRRRRRTSLGSTKQRGESS